MSPEKYPERRRGWFEAALCLIDKQRRSHYEHVWKALCAGGLPTFLRKYDKVARQCAAEDVDYPHYLLRMNELELLDRERRVCQAKFPVVKSVDRFEFLAVPSLNKAMVWSGPLRVPAAPPFETDE